MEDSSNYPSCKSTPPSKSTPSNNIYHANPSTKHFQDINDKSNIERSWTCSLLCNRCLPHSSVADLSQQYLTKHIDPIRFLYGFPLQQNSSFMIDANEFLGFKDVNKITLHLKQLCGENGFKILVNRTKNRCNITIKEFGCNHNRPVQSSSDSGLSPTRRDESPNNENEETSITEYNKRWEKNKTFINSH